MRLKAGLRQRVELQRLCATASKEQPQARLPLHLMRYLNFELTEATDDIFTLDAMASTREAEHAAVMAEVAQVLAWAQAEFAGRQGPVEEGHAWDHELLVQHEAGGWVTVTLTFSASAEFAEAFLAMFDGAGNQD